MREQAVFDNEMLQENNNEHLMHRNEYFQSSCGKNLDLCGGKVISCEVFGEKTLNYVKEK